MRRPPQPPPPTSRVGRAGRSRLTSPQPQGPRPSHAGRGLGEPRCPCPPLRPRAPRPAAPDLPLSSQVCLFQAVRREPHPARPWRLPAVGRALPPLHAARAPCDCVRKCLILCSCSRSLPPELRPAPWHPASRPPIPHPLPSSLWTPLAAPEALTLRYPGATGGLSSVHHVSEKSRLPVSMVTWSGSRGINGCFFPR